MLLYTDCFLYLSLDGCCCFFSHGVVGDHREGESARLGLAVEGEVTFCHVPTSEKYRRAELVGKVVCRNAEWSRVEHVEMMEKESETSTQMRVALGLMYELEEVIPQDLQRARELYKSAGVEGDLDGTVHLGCLYFNGLGVPMDGGVGWKLLTKAASGGHDVALVQCMCCGVGGFTKDKAQGIQLLKGTISMGVMNY